MPHNKYIEPIITYNYELVGSQKIPAIFESNNN